jgi:hypothetical protein
MKVVTVRLLKLQGPLVGTVPVPPGPFVQRAGMYNAVKQAQTTALIITTESDLESEAHSALEAKPESQCI